MVAAKADGWSPRHAEKWLRMVEKDLFPWLGSLPLASITAPVLLAALRRTESQPQALAILKELRPLSGHGRFVFPSLLTGERCMSENTVRAALRRMGYSNDDMTAHGFWAMARTLIAERLPCIQQEVIKAQPARGKAGPLGMAYDRSEYLDQRRQMMQAWADCLDRLREGGQVLPFKAA